MKSIRNLLLLCLVFITIPFAFAQQADSLPSEFTDTIQTYEIVEVFAAFPGGLDSMNKFVMRNLRYPDIALENCIQGTVIASFIVERDGSISNIEILKSIGGGCDEEVIRIIHKMPKWTPGYQRGVPVRVKMKMPLKFKMSGCEKLKLHLNEDVEQIVNERFPKGITGLQNFFESQGIFFKIADYVRSKSPAHITLTIAPNGTFTVADIAIPYCSKCGKELEKDLKKMPQWKAAAGSKPVTISFQIIPEEEK